MNNKNTLCSTLWSWPIINIARNEVKMCCRTQDVIRISNEELDEQGIDVFTNHHFYKEQRKQLLEGIKTKNCQYCWDIEEKNIFSPRNNKVDTLDSIKKIANNENLLISTFPTKLEIHIGNVCDMQCAYCGPWASSKWTEYNFKNKAMPSEERKHYQQIFKKNDTDFMSLFWQWLETRALNSIETISILGGEPALNPEYFNLLSAIQKKLKDSDKKIRVIVITNLNTKNLKKFIDSFDDSNENIVYEIRVSAEAIEKRAEFIRIGMDWQRFDKNLNELIAFTKTRKNVKVNMLASVNSLTISSTEDFLRWINEKNIRFNTKINVLQNIINTHKWLSPSILDKSYAVYLDNAVRYCNENKCFDDYVPFLLAIKQSIEKNDHIKSENKENFIKELSMITQINQMSFTEIFPEMRSIIE